MGKIAITLMAAILASNLAYSQPTAEEIKARAMVEILKEQKDKEERARIDKAKQELLNQSSSDRGNDSNVGLIIVMVILGPPASE